MTKKQKRIALRVLISGLMLVLGYLVPDGFSLYLFLPAYVLIGYDVLYHAGRNLFTGQLFDENFLMCLATVGALATGDYPEAVFVMLFYQVGSLFESYAVGRSRASIAELMNIRPDMARVVRNGQPQEVAPEQVQVGETILVAPGERVPLDGVVSQGESALDTSALTGESLPRNLGPGDEALSGCINQSGLLEIQVTKPFGQSTVNKILEMVEHAASKKARTETFITRFARYYTPCVVVCALLLCLLPPLFTGQPFAIWLRRALIFLVVSCPCALVISVPLGFFGGIGGASRQGILIKGSNYLEALAHAQIVAMDKTGTLTQGRFSVQACYPVAGVDQATLLETAALAECYSSHPIAQSLREAWGQPLQDQPVEQVQERSGHGVRAMVRGVWVAAGSESYLSSLGFHPATHGEHVGTLVHVARGDAYLGYIHIADQLKPDAIQALSNLRTAGVEKLVMLTGDSTPVAAHIAAQLGLDEFHSELLPEDKVAYMEALRAQLRNGTLVFVGDGINDAPVLAQADVGIAMGGLGSDAAIEAADVVIMDDHPARIPIAISIARRTMAIVRQNIVFALGVKAIVLLMGALGVATMWEAVFADVGVSVIAILNSMRALKIKKQ